MFCSRSGHGARSGYPHDPPTQHHRCGGGPPMGLPNGASKLLPGPGGDADLQQPSVPQHMPVGGDTVRLQIEYF